VIIVVAGLTALGVVLATANNSPPGLSASSLQLHGQPPRTATVALSVSTGAVTVTGTVHVNFVTNELDGVIQIPAVFSTATYRLVAAHHHLYLNVPSLASTVRSPWVTMMLPTPSLVRLDAALQNAGRSMTSPRRPGTTVTHAGAFTTYTNVDAHARVAVPPNFPVTVPASVQLTSATTVGPQGQFAARSDTFSAPNFFLSVQVTVVAYNSRVVISTPPGRDVQPLTPQLLTRVFGPRSSKIRRFLTPAGIASLSQLRV